MSKLFTGFALGLALGYALTHNVGVTITTAPAHEISTPVVQPQEDTRRDPR